MTPKIPLEYKKYLNEVGGFEGFTIGDTEPGYVVLWPLDEISRNNADIQMEEYAPEFLAFGGNGGGEVLAFNDVGAIFMLPMVGLDEEDAIQVAGNFSDLATRFEIAKP